MKKTAGFTLIELVIVIVILGILGAVAAPRFLNLQGDAYKANVNTLKSSVQSAATLANAKATLQGDEKATSVTFEGIANPVAFSGGYPASSAAGIIRMLEDSQSFSTTGTDTPYIISGDEKTGVLIIAPTNRGVKLITAVADEKCQVEYTQAVYSAAAAGSEDAVIAVPLSVKAFVKGC